MKEHGFVPMFSFIKVKKSFALFSDKAGGFFADYGAGGAITGRGLFPCLGAGVGQKYLKSHAA